MLVLSRKRGQSVIIGNEIVVKVVEVNRDIIKLGIEAPREISVHREEVYEMIRKENRKACRSILSYKEAVDRARDGGEGPAIVKGAKPVSSVIKASIVKFTQSQQERGRDRGTNRG